MLKMLRLLTVFFFLFSSLARGFTLFPHTASAADPTHLYVWPLETCPSEINGHHFAPIIAGVALVLGADAIAGLVNMATAPLSAGATADKDGYQANGTNASYYFTAVLKTATTYVAQPPTCYVVAYTKPDSKEPADAALTDWCNDPGFAAGAAATCKNDAGRKTLQTLATYQDLYAGSGSNGIQPLALPKFYAEISLADSGYSAADQSFKVVQPRFAAMYYPNSLLGSLFENNKPRHLVIQLGFASYTSGSSDPFKSATVNLDLFGVVPGASIPSDVLLNNTQAGWAVVPSIPVPATYQYEDAQHKLIPGPFLPVTISATLHEVGDENAFLQAFASAFTSSASHSAISNLLSNSLLPGSATSLQNTATLQTAESKYLASVSTYQTACTTYKQSNASNADANKSNAQSAYLATQSGWSTVQVSAVAAGTTPSIDQVSLKECY